MKRITFLMCLCFCSVMIFGQGIEFFHGSYADALEKAKKENKRIFVDVYTSWCGPCKQMAKDVFTQPEVGKYYNSNFVCLKLDAEKEKDHPFFEKYQAGGYPSFFWLDATGSLIEMNVGYLQPQVLIQKGQTVKDSKSAEVWSALRKRWEGGERSREVFDGYVNGYLAKAEPAKVRECCLDYLKSLDEVQLKSEHTYRILQSFNREPLEDGFILDCQMKYWNDYMKYDDYTSFNTNRYRWLVRNACVAAKQSDEAVQKHIRLLKSREFPRKQMYLEVIDAEVELGKDVHEGIRRLSRVAQKYGGECPLLYSFFSYSMVLCGYFSPSDRDTTCLAEARDITERAYELLPSQETAVYLAVTQAKAGDLRKAISTFGVVPFLPKPMLSSALYSHIGLVRTPVTAYGRIPECKEMQAKVAELTGKKKK